MKKIFSYFTKSEIILWTLSVLFIIISFLLFDRGSYLALIASLLGATALIFCAKGNPIGMMILIVFCLLYGCISFTNKYYGEMITYLGMSLPMSVYSLVSWVKNPYKCNVSEVAVRKLRKNDIFQIVSFTLVVTVIFYLILDYFNTANLIVSTFSVSTSFFAVMLTSKRSPYYALAYALNDIVLIVLWVFAAFDDKSYVSVVICFITFLVNDLYGFFNWRRMAQRQRGE